MATQNAHRRMLAPALLLVSFLAGTVDMANATNMGFRFNRGIAPLGASPIGQNWVALPYTHIYPNAEALCAALGLAPGTSAVRRIDAATGVTFSHTCGNPGSFPLPAGACGIVTTAAPTAGIITGSEPSVLPAPRVLSPLGVAPIGQNLFSVPFNSTACTAQDLCSQMALPVGASIVRRNAVTGVSSSHSCGNPGAFTLVLGECVLIRYPGPTIALPPLPHF